MNISWWRVLAPAAALALFLGTWIYAVVGTPSAALAWTMGPAVIVIGMGCQAAATARILRENAGQRVPFWGTPPVRPRRLDLLAGLGIPLVAGGALLIGRAFDRGVWPALALIAVLTICVVLPQLAHNRRLSAA